MHNARQKMVNLISDYVEIDTSLMLHTSMSSVTAQLRNIA